MEKQEAIASPQKTHRNLAKVDGVELSRHAKRKCGEPPEPSYLGNQLTLPRNNIHLCKKLKKIMQNIQLFFHSLSKDIAECPLPAGLKCLLEVHCHLRT